jgi:Amt family ammonium transporter
MRLQLGLRPRQAVLGGLEHTLLRGVGIAPNADYSQWVSHNLFAIYQLMFAIITPALTIGAIAERMKFKAVMLFSVLWLFIVYFPVAHMIWGAGGWMNGIWRIRKPRSARSTSLVASSCT